MEKIFKRKSVEISVVVILIIGLTAIYRPVKYYFTPDIIYIHADYYKDMSNDNVLAGFADNIFIGKVEDKTGNKKLIDGIPQTQFEVEVIENIKGTLDGNITVNQDAGFKGFKLYLFEKDMLLQQGHFYLFVTKYNKDEEWHNLVPYYGDILIDRLGWERNVKELIERFTKAYENEIEFE